MRCKNSSRNLGLTLGQHSCNAGRLCARSVAKIDEPVLTAHHLSRTRAAQLRLFGAGTCINQGEQPCLR